MEKKEEYSNPSNVIGGLLRRYRKEKKLRQQDVADQLGVSHSWYCLLEGGRGKTPNPNLPLLKKACQIVGIPLPLMLLEESSKEEILSQKEGYTKIINYLTSTLYPKLPPKKDE